MSSHPFDQALKLQALAPDRYAGRTSEAYWNMVGPFGGCTAATVLAAILQHPDRLGAPLSVTVNFAAALAQGRDAVGPDFQFHLEVARATQNPHFAELMGTLGAMIIPRARLGAEAGAQDAQRSYLQRANAEHENIYDAIANQDVEAARAAMRTHLANSRERRRRAAGLSPQTGK
jgi:DNA-binding FadR family transcriptional regulator